MKDSIEIYVQPGRYGQHAGGRYPCSTFAAHATDERTAAWRAALKHWFPSRPNGVLLYAEARAITMERFGHHEWKAMLDIPDEEAKAMQWARSFTPTFGGLKTEPLPYGRGDTTTLAAPDGSAFKRRRANARRQVKKGARKK